MGRLELIAGPMFAGKTSELLRRIRDKRAQGLNVVVVKSHVDTRYSADHIMTHDNTREPCVPLERLRDLPARIGEAAYAAAQVVAVDEAQFIADLQQDALQMAERDGKTVVLAGLLGDFRRSAFGELHSLVPLADSVQLLQGRCQFCAAPSVFTLRHSASSSVTLVGGADSYSPVCRRHYVEMSRVRGEAQQGQEVA